LLIVLLWVAAAMALLGMVTCMVAIGMEAKRVPNRPQHMRLNPFNILADQGLWTPEIRRLNRRAVRLGVAFLACALAGALASLLAAPR
jgi:hypothetical protein